MEEQLEDDKATFDQIIEEFEGMKETIATEESVAEVREIAENAMSIVTNQQAQVDQVTEEFEDLRNDFDDL